MRKQHQKKIIIGAVILLLIFLYEINKNNNIIFKKNIILPIQTIAQTPSILIGTFFNKIINKNNNIANEKNIIEIGKIIQNEKIKLLIKENKELKETLQFLDDNDYLQNKEKKWETAYLIGRDSLDQNIFIINKGSNQGIKIGMPIIQNYGVLIGKIIEVKKNSASFILIIDNRSQIYATINNEDEISGLVEGNYNFSIKMNLIPINKNIKNGDIITTSGKEKFIPAGFLIGKIKKIEKKDNDIFQSAELESFSSFNNIKIVTVIK